MTAVYQMCAFSFTVESYIWEEIVQLEALFAGGHYGVIMWLSFASGRWEKVKVPSGLQATTQYPPCASIPISHDFLPCFSFSSYISLLDLANRDSTSELVSSAWSSPFPHGCMAHASFRSPLSERSFLISLYHTLSPTLATTYSLYFALFYYIVFRISICFYYYCLCFCY